MTPVPTPDFRLTGQDLAEQLRFCSVTSDGMFSVTLFKENGQGYNVVLHAGGGTDKTRIALVSQPSNPRCVVGSSWEVRDIIERVLTSNGRFPEAIAAVVDRTLVGSLGCVLLKIEGGIVVKAHFHEGELWP